MRSSYNDYGALSRFMAVNTSHILNMEFYALSCWHECGFIAFLFLRLYILIVSRTYSAVFWLGINSLNFNENFSGVDLALCTSSANLQQQPAEADVCACHVLIELSLAHIHLLCVLPAEKTLTLCICSLCCIHQIMPIL